MSTIAIDTVDNILNIAPDLLEASGVPHYTFRDRVIDCISDFNLGNPTVADVDYRMAERFRDYRAVAVELRCAAVEDVLLDMHYTKCESKYHVE
jgi:hypothetical protein